MRLPADNVRAAAAGCSGGSGDEAQPHAEAGHGPALGPSIHSPLPAGPAHTMRQDGGVGGPPRAPLPAPPHLLRSLHWQGWWAAHATLTGCTE